MPLVSFKVSKVDAARRQLRTAITLWFADIDPVSTHTLAFASYEILHAVSKKRDPNRDKLLFDSSLIKEEFRSELNIAFKKHAYFFKHGDREPEAIIEFNPEATECFIIFAIYALQLCGEAAGEEEAAFILWTQVHKPKLFTDDAGKPLVEHLPVDAVHYVRGIAKKKFLSAYKIAHAHKLGGLSSR